MSEIKSFIDPELIKRLEKINNLLSDLGKIIELLEERGIEVNISGAISKIL